MGRRDPRWVLAIVAILGAFGLQIYLSVNCSTATVDDNCVAEAPQWVVGLVSSVVAYYFGARNGRNAHPSEFTPSQIATAMNEQVKHANKPEEPDAPAEETPEGP